MQGSWSIPGARLGASLLGLSLLFAAPARADLNVGISVSATGPAASLGIPEKNSVALLPASIGGHKVNYIVLDDASDTTAAVKNARKLIAEHRVDVIVGSTTSPNSLAMIDAVAEGERIELDLSGVERMDSAGCQLLMLAKREASAGGKTLSIVAHSPAVQSLIEFYNLAAWFGDPLVVPAR